jgi:hypothetical protein
MSIYTPNTPSPDLGDAYSHGHIQGQSNRKMLFGHSDKTSVGTDHQKDKGRGTRRQPVQGSLQVSFMSGKIYGSKIGGIFVMKGSPYR